MKIKCIAHERVIPDIELNYYIPITIEYKSNDYPTKELYYYRILNDDSSFIEFKVNSESKKIFSIILVSINGISKYSDIQTDFRNIPTEEGNPIICSEIWNNCTTLTTKSNFSIMYNGSELFLLPENKNVVAKKICMSNIELLVNKDMKVIGCIFVDIPINKKYVLEECVNKFIKN